MTKNNTTDNSAARNDGSAPHINNIGADAETFDNVPEAGEEAQADGDAMEAEVVNEMTQIETLTQKLTEAEEAVAKEKKEYLFLMAEFDNFRKRTLKEKSELIKNGGENAMRGILPVVDDLERSIQAMKETSDAEAIKDGIELIYNKFVKYLDQNGVKPIASDAGNEFDTEIHEAVTTFPTDDESQKGKVIDTIQKGYTLNGKVLRHAKVVVGQ